MPDDAPSIRNGRDDTFFSKNFGVLISAATAVLGLSLSGAQVWVAYIQADREAAQRAHEDEVAGLQRAHDLDVQERKDLREFVVKNYSQIITGNDQDRERMKNLMLLTYSAPVVTPVIEALSLVSPESQRNTWNQAQVEVAGLVDQQAWAVSPPEQAWCYQEEKPAGHYGVYCHLSSDRCNTAKRGSGTATPCVLVTGLTQTGWRPQPKGFLNSWFQTGLDHPLPAPFPQR